MPLKTTTTRLTSYDQGTSFAWDHTGNRRTVGVLTSVLEIDPDQDFTEKEFASLAARAHPQFAPPGVFPGTAVEGPFGVSGVPITSIRVRHLGNNKLAHITRYGFRGSASNTGDQPADRLVTRGEVGLVQRPTWFDPDGNLRDTSHPIVTVEHGGTTPVTTRWLLLKPELKNHNFVVMEFLEPVNFNPIPLVLDLHNTVNSKSFKGASPGSLLFAGAKWTTFENLDTGVLTYNMRWEFHLAGGDKWQHEIIPGAPVGFREYADQGYNRAVPVSEYPDTLPVYPGSRSAALQPIYEAKDFNCWVGGGVGRDEAERRRCQNEG
jgi:hypothetical protein